MVCHSTREMQRGPVLDGLPEWYLAGQLRNFKSGHRGKNPANRAEALMGAAMAKVESEAQLAALARHFAARKPQPFIRVVRGNIAIGRAHYATRCASCHGAKLEGQPDWRKRNADGTLKAPPHDETGHTWHHPDNDMFRYTKQGGQALAPPGFKSAMPGFGDSLSDREIWAVLSYSHTFWPAKIRERQRSLNAQSRAR